MDRSLTSSSAKAGRLPRKAIAEVPRKARRGWTASPTLGVKEYELCRQSASARIFLIIVAILLLTTPVVRL